MRAYLQSVAAGNKSAGSRRVTAAFAARSAAAKVGTLAVVPGPVVAADGVVVGDRAAAGEDHLRDRLS